jgi:hypothetical protein
LLTGHDASNDMPRSTAAINPLIAPSLPAPKASSDLRPPFQSRAPLIASCLPDLPRSYPDRCFSWPASLCEIAFFLSGNLTSKALISPKIRNARTLGPAGFPVFFPVTREWGASETGSLMTASSSGESANLRSRFRDDAVRATASKMRRCWLPGSALEESQKVGAELLLMGDRQSAGYKSYVFNRRHGPAWPERPAF